MSAYHEGDGVFKPETQPQEPANGSEDQSPLRSECWVFGGGIAGRGDEGAWRIHAWLLWLFARLIEECANLVTGRFSLKEYTEHP